MTKNQYLKILFEKLADFLKQGKEYNISITSQKFEVKEMKEAKQTTQLQLNGLRTTLNEVLLEMRSGFKQVNSRLDNLEQDVSELKQDMIEVKKDIAIIKSLPTIKKEIKELKK